MAGRLLNIGKQARPICIGLVLAAHYGHAQNNTYPWPQSGSVGIGTTSPGDPFVVYNSTYSSGFGVQPGCDNANKVCLTGNNGGSRYIVIDDANKAIQLWTNNTQAFTLNSAGTVGIGTTSPTGGSLVIGSQTVARNQRIFPYAYFGSSYSAWDTIIGSNVRAREGTTNVGYELGSSYTGQGASMFLNSFGNYSGLYQWKASDISGYTEGQALILPTPTIYFDPNRNVGIGTANPASLLSVGATSQFQVNASGSVTSGSIVSSGPVGIGMSPQYTLDVAGQIHASQAIYASGGITFSDGSSLSSANTLCGGDYAESVDVTGNRTKYEPGDVLVIDPNTSGKFLKSAEPYSTAVTGIYSTKPGAVGRRQSTPRSDAEVPMAMIGIVPTKVSAENGPIHRGDLLVTSSTIGYAMKGTDRSRLTGAVIGKALDSLESGMGVIEVVVTLQ